MKFVQLHYFLSQNVGMDKRYYVPPAQKLGGTCPPHKLGPWLGPTRKLLDNSRSTGR